MVYRCSPDLKFGKVGIVLKQSKGCSANAEGCAAHTKIQPIEIIGNMLQICPAQGPHSYSSGVVSEHTQAAFDFGKIWKEWNMIALLCIAPFSPGVSGLQRPVSTSVPGSGPPARSHAPWKHRADARRENISTLGMILLTHSCSLRVLVSSSKM